MTVPVRVRFAPSPTGLLHIGNARTAVFNYLYALRHHGTLILRIEDTDIERSAEMYTDRIMEDLQWLGIHWQEGPDRGGDEGPYLQSQRLSLYQDYAERLNREGHVYKCFCSNERLEALRQQQLSKGTMPRYDGRCRSLSKDDVTQLESSGQQPVLRFHVKGPPVIFDDLVHGRMNFDPSGIGDFILVRSDGMAAYNFACVIDDHAMHVTHVIRGEDHLSNTPRQILVYRALGWEPPAFAHHPLILGPDRSPLSKRHGVTAVSHYREEGFLPEALLNYLVLLGWTPPTGQEIFSQEEITDVFSIEAVSRSAPVFSRQKLEWLNSHYLRQKSDAELSVLLAPYLARVGLAPDRIDPAYLARVAGALKENLVLLSEAEGYLGIFFDEKFLFHEEANALLRDGTHRETLRRILLVFNVTPVITEENWPSFLSRLAKETGRKGKALYAPLRAAATGMMKGPELVKTFPLLGRERVIKRIEMALETTGSG